MNKKIIIASESPVKIEAVIRGFESMFPEESFEYQGVSVSSDVSDQPSSSGETLAGAQNRAMNAQQEIPDADYWIGIEGGIEVSGNEMESFAWVIVYRRDSLRVGKSKTASLYLPEKIADLVKNGKELGDAADEVFGLSHSKCKTGTTGFLTGDVITRATYYSSSVILALVPFAKMDIY